MSSIIFKLGKNSIRNVSNSNIIFYSTKNYQAVSNRAYSKNIGPFGWFLLVVPVSTFSLGVWQVKRKFWKENLIADLKQKTSSQPIQLPEDLDDLQDLEYRPIHVRGTFQHDKELYLGPRSLLLDGDASTKSSLLADSGSSKQGYQVITPLKLENRDLTILVNRGWVPLSNKNPKTRQDGQVSDTVDVIGIVRHHENRPPFAVKNKASSKIYFYRDLREMSKVTGAAPIFVDATNDSDVPNGPIGGQTRISLRNEHLSYVVTWFSLCGITSYMWFKKFVK